MNIHHPNEITPCINDPFFNLDLQAARIDEAHRKGIKRQQRPPDTPRCLRIQRKKSPG